MSKYVKFSQALEAMIRGKRAKLKNGKAVYSIRCYQNRLTQRDDMRMYVENTVGKVSRVREINVRFITMFDWEIIDDEID